MGSSIIARPEKDTTEGTIFIVDTTEEIEKAGRLTRWEYLNTLPGVTFYLQVWRFSSLSTPGERYILVNQTEIITPSSTSQNQTMNLNDSASFSVESGDVLGNV